MRCPQWTRSNTWPPVVPRILADEGCRRAGGPEDGLLVHLHASADDGDDARSRRGSRHGGQEPHLDDLWLGLNGLVVQRSAEVDSQTAHHAIAAVGIGTVCALRPRNLGDHRGKQIRGPVPGGPASPLSPLSPFAPGAPGAPGAPAVPGSPLSPFAPGVPGAPGVARGARCPRITLVALGAGCAPAVPGFPGFPLSPFAPGCARRRTRRARITLVSLIALGTLLTFDVGSVEVPSAIVILAKLCRCARDGRRCCKDLGILRDGEARLQRHFSVAMTRASAPGSGSSAGSIDGDVTSRISVGLFPTRNEARSCSVGLQRHAPWARSVRQRQVCGGIDVQTDAARPQRRRRV